MFLSETRSAGSCEGRTKELLGAFLSLITLTGSATSLMAFCVKTSEGPHQYSAQRKMEWKSLSLKSKLEEVEKFDDHLPIKL